MSEINSIKKIQRGSEMVKDGERRIDVGKDEREKMRSMRKEIV